MEKDALDGIIKKDLAERIARTENTRAIATFTTLVIRQAIERIGETINLHAALRGTFLKAGSKTDIKMSHFLGAGDFFMLQSGRADRDALEGRAALIAYNYCAKLDVANLEGLQNANAHRQVIDHIAGANVLTNEVQTTIGIQRLAARDEIQDALSHPYNIEDVEEFLQQNWGSCIAL